MALKFLNKKGWHTGSLRNIENVWKAEQKHEAEQRKLEELKKQIHEERDRAEFRELQVQAGLIPKQERLDFLYESGLAVGKGSSSFKALESLPKTDPDTTASSSTSAKQQSGVPGALFEEKEKPQSANDAWRKLHSDPLLMIRQREQEALARVTKNPVQMAMIRKSVEAKKDNDKDEKKKRSKHHKKKSKHRKLSSSENDSDSEDVPLTVEKERERHHKGSNSDKPSRKATLNSDEEPSERDDRRKKYYDNEYKHRRPSEAPNTKYDKSEGQHRSKRSHSESQRKEYSSERQVEYRHDKRSHYSSSDKPPRNESNNRHRNPVKLSEEERAARLREMQMDAERHEEQRWKRLKKAADSDAQEAIRDNASMGRNFLDAAKKSVFGAEKGGSSTIEESVRRRTHYSQGRLATDSNAFRR
ncbi:hypothetical protein BUALT_Bualt03G0096900 [Buddleja alternifolia]|uniref:CBF1-interacting co-repressor CIR N-terminal domain-containing protein n=1 Tax=Buddleja alternifolia TaxID=168488 RepID=A0AAV6Y3N9_9LAMI|nr:hypothetical protein BUALT_Bualt03G0096900 [Buddleja alternifolia]